ncbi:MAG: type IV pilus modification protein PilV [Rhodocyclaceae bacterium]|nr:type IV pilus modification protein PilV [Rhodocyclaceae bacterium]
MNKRLESQRGALLLEVLVSIVIFSIGILAMISMQAASVAAQADAQYRVEAGRLIDQLIANIRVSVTHDPSTGALNTTNLDTFKHRAPAVASTATTCPFGNTANSTNSVVTDWIAAVQGLDTGGNPVPGKGLPGNTDDTTQEIVVDHSTAGINQVRVTLCWRAPGDTAYHWHRVLAYVD